MERDRQEKKEKKKKKMKKIYLILALSIFMISFASAADWDNIMNYNEDSDTIKITNMFGLGKDLAMAQLEDNFCNEGRWCEADKEITLYKEGILIEDFKTLRIDDGSYDEQNIRWHKLEYFGIIEDFNNKCNTKTTFNKINNTYYNNTICEYIKVGEHNGWIEFKEGDIFEAGTYKVRTTGEIKPGRLYDWQIKIQGKWTTPWAVWGNISLGDDAEVILNSPADGSISYINPVTFNATANVTGGAILTNMSLWSNATGTWSLADTNQLFFEGIAATGFDSSGGGAPYTENGGINFSVSIGIDSLTVKKLPTDGNTAKLEDSSGNVLISSSFVGDVAVINYPIQANVSYLIVTDSNGSSCDYKINQTAGLPKTEGIFTFKNAIFNNVPYSSANFVFNIANLSYSKTSSTELFNLSITQPTTWNIEACDNDGDCGFAANNFTVLPDTTNPIINLSYPNGIIDYSKVGDLLNLNWTATDDGTIDTCWYEYNNTNTTVTCEDNYTTFNIDTAKELTFYANDSFGNLASNTTSWDYKIFENNRTLNTSSYETQSETFSINITANSSLTSVKLLYNETEYSTTKSGTVYSTTLDIPENQLGNNSVRWEFTYNGDTIYSDYSYQNISKIVFALCNATYADDFLNISFKDESDLSAINATIPTSTFEYYLGSGTETKTYIYSNVTLNHNYSFCASPNLSLNVEPYIQYKQGTTYPQRVWEPSVQVYNSTVTQKILYLLSSVDGIYVTFQITNQADQPIQDATVVATRLIDGEDITVGVGTTGADGGVTLWLNPDFVHDFTFSKSGYDEYETSFAPTQSGYTISLSGGVSVAPNDYFRGITYSVLPTNTSLTNDTDYIFGFNLTSTYWDLEEYGFNLRLSNGTIISGGSTSTSGTQLTKSYNTNNQSRIFIDSYWAINGTYTNITKMLIVYNTELSGFSISNFFTDMKAYMDSGIFGLDNFGRYLITFLIIAFAFGMISYRFGLSSPSMVTFLLFVIILFLDVIIGLIPQINLMNGTAVPHLLTYIAGLIATITIIREVQV